MTISNEDIRETAVDLLSRLGMTLPCTMELVYADGFLMSQPTTEVPGDFLDKEGVVLTNAIDAEPLAEYLLAFEDRIEEQPTYLMADAAVEGFRIRLACDAQDGNAVTWRVQDV